MAHISGSKGNLRMDDFVLPYFGNRLGFTASNSIFDCDICDFRMERRETAYQVEEYASSHPSAQESNCFGIFLDWYCPENWTALAENHQTDPKGSDVMHGFGRTGFGRVGVFGLVKTNQPVLMTRERSTERAR